MGSLGLWRRAGQPLLRHRLAVAGLLAVSVATAVLGIASPFLARTIIDDALPHKNEAEATIAAVAMLVVGLLQIFSSLARGQLVASLAGRITSSLRASLLMHIHAMPESFFAEARSGTLLSQVMTDIDGLEAFYNNLFGTVIATGIGVAVTVIAMLLLNWRLSIVAFVLAPLFILPGRIVAPKLRALRREALQRRDALHALSVETLTPAGATLMKAFGRRSYEAARLSEATRTALSTELRQTLLTRLGFLPIGIVTAVSPGVVWLIGSTLVLKGSTTTGSLVAFAAFLIQLYGPVQMLTDVQVRLASAMPFFERLFELFDLPEENVHSGTVELSSIQKEIAFEDVVFSYSGSTNALDGLSVTIGAGKTVAFVGSTGSGKSTITKLLPRFYDPQHGRITIDGVDIREFDLDSLRAHIAIVSQEPFLFNDTIGANIRYARLDASDEDVAEAVEAARLSSVIARLAEGLDTVVGDRGAKLSGGERQRVAVARALLKDAEVLILDEATSALDSETEALLQAAIRGAMLKRTCIVVAHRLSTIVDADLICVVAEGRIAESGTHRELLERRGPYTRLWDLQTAAALTRP